VPPTYEPSGAKVEPPPPTYEPSGAKDVSPPPTYEPSGAKLQLPPTYQGCSILIKVTSDKLASHCNNFNN
jgi:hypothetical protein